MPGGNTRTVLHYAPFPIAIARAGLPAVGPRRREYIDFLGEYTAGLYGHSHPVIRAAVDRALDTGINFGGTNMTEAKFARAVCDRFGLERVRFTNSGTEANLLAISLGRIFTRRKKVMVFDGGYHGAVFGFAGGGSPINVPFDYVLAPYNDIDATRALISGTGDLALVILEPMIGSGGCIAANARVPGDAARGDHEGRRAADPGRGDDVASGAGRAAAGAWRQAGSDDIGQIHRRRHVVRRIRRARRNHGSVRSAAAGRAAARRDVQQQRADDDGRPDGPDRGLYAGGGACAERAWGGVAGAVERAVPRRDAPMQFTGIGSMLAVHTTRGPVRSRRTRRRAIRN